MSSDKDIKVKVIISYKSNLTLFFPPFIELSDTLLANTRSYVSECSVEVIYRYFPDIFHPLNLKNLFLWYLSDGHHGHIFDNHSQIGH